MVNELQTIKTEEGKEIAVIDSREVAEMMGKGHAELLRDIDGRDNYVGIIPTLEKANLALSKYFIESSYKAGTREYKCYLCTKMGCELLGNKQQGAKGILFTAKYVERFNEYEKKLKELSQSQLPTDYLTALKALVASEEQKQKLLEENNKNKPKVNYYEQVLNPSDVENGFTKLVSTTDIAKDLGMTARQLNKKLNDKGVIYKQGKCWKVYNDYNFLIVEKYCDYTINQFGQTLKWTEKGREWVINILNS